MARDLGMDRKTFTRLRTRLLAEIRERFMEKWEEVEKNNNRTSA